MISDLKEATQAIARIAILQRDLYVLNAELQAMRQAKRIAFAVAGAVLLSVTLLLTLGWITVALHEAGASAWNLVLSCLLGLGSVSGLCFLIAVRIGREGKLETHRTRPTHQPQEEKRARVPA